MECDAIGTESILNLIDQSGHTKFSVYKTGTVRGVPVFEFNASKTNAEAKKRFLDWANAMNFGNNNQNVYEIVLFSGDADPDDDDAKGKKSKIRFSFCLSTKGIGVGSISGTGQNMSEMIDIAVKSALRERDNADLKKEIESLKKEIESNDFDDDDNDDDYIGETQNSDLLQILRDSGIISALLGKVGLKEPAPVLNGLEQTSEPINLTNQQKTNINTALKVLLKHDPQLDKDLLKLAALSENNTQQFNFVLNALRNM